MKINEFFNGRFGSFYLIKVWAFIILFGDILFVIIQTLPQAFLFDFQFYSVILLIFIYGIVLCLPSLMISGFFYQSFSKRKLSNRNVLIYTIIVALIMTNITYLIFWLSLEKELTKMVIIFVITYNITLISGFFIFKPKSIKIKNVHN